MIWQPGQKVVYVDDSQHPWGKRHAKDTWPELNTVYTIREIIPERQLLQGILGASFTLVEIKNPYRRWFPNLWEEQHFGIHRFRPVRETNIDCFRKLLLPQPELV